LVNLAFNIYLFILFITPRQAYHSSNVKQKSFPTLQLTATLKKCFYLCQVIEVKKLTKFFPQFCLGNNSVGHKLEALLLYLENNQTN